MIDSFVNAIVLYDDKIIFYFNYKENAETLYQKDLEDFSDLFVSAPPNYDGGTVKVPPSLSFTAVEPSGTRRRAYPQYKRKRILRGKMIR